VLPAPDTPLLSREAFHRWVRTQPSGCRFERIDGRPVAMAPERLGHARAKARIWRALEAALVEAGLPCEAIIDGITVEVGEDCDYEPDVVIDCGTSLSDDNTAAVNPIVIVEVVSPGTASTDTGAKLQDYFRLPGLNHYLVVRADRRAVTVHSRDGDGRIATTILRAGPLTLDPPGITVDLACFFDR